MTSWQSPAPALGALLLVAALAASARGENGAPAAGVDDGTGWSVERMDLDVTVLAGEERILVEGTAELRLDAPRSTGPVLVLNSRDPVMRFTDLEAEGARVDLHVAHPDPALASDEITEAGAGAARILFPHPLERGARTRVRFTCRSEGRSFQFVVSQRMAIASWVEGWVPSPLTPDGADAAASAAPGSIRLVLPSGWHALSNGRLVKRDDDGANVEVWESERAVTRSFIAGPYEVSTEKVDGREIGIYLLSPKPMSGAEQAATLARALEAMEARFGPYPYPSYGIAEVPPGLVDWGASSEQGFIMAVSMIFSAEGGNLPLFAHEAAHGWWGNLVNTRGPGALLCGESLAQYGAVLAIEALEGVEARNHFLEYSRPGYNMIQCARGYFEIWRRGGDKPMAELGDGPWDHNLSDAKGHWVYHMLRNEIGDQRFFATLRGLLTDYAGRSLSLDDVRSAFEAAAPEDSLQAFFAQWLDRGGAPVLDVDWWANEDGDGAEFLVLQKQEGEPFRIDLEVDIDTADGDTHTETFSIRQREERFRVETDSRPLEVRIDPRRRLLIWRPEYGPPPPGP